MSKKHKTFIIKALKTLLKFGAAVLAVYLLFRDDSEKIRNGLRTFNYLYLIPAAVLYLLHTLVSAWRWQILARIQGIKMRFAEAYSLTMQGYFFSLIIPGGAVGGDVIKMTATSSRLPEGSKMEGAFSVLIDRVVGMIALFAVTLALIFPARELFYKLDIPEMPEKLTGALLFWLVAVLCAAGICAGTVLFFHRTVEKIPGVSAVLRFADKRTGGMISRLMNAADLYSGNKKLLCKLILASVSGVHLLTLLPIIFLLAGSGSHTAVLTALTALTVGNIAGLIPLFPGGIGSRDIVTVALLTAGGVAGNHADAAQILYTSMMGLTYLSGGLFFIFDPGRKLHCSGVKK